MKTHHVLILAAAIVMAGGVANAVQSRIVDNEALNAMSPPVIPAGNAYDTLTVNASDTSIQMTPNAVYCMTCVGTTGYYYEFSDTSSCTAAAAGSHIYPEGAQFCWRVDAAGDSDYVCAIDVGGAAGICTIQRND